MLKSTPYLFLLDKGKFIMKLEASKQKFKKSFIISLFFSILYTSPLLAVDYVYDKTKLTDDEIIRLKKTPR
ncbi:hypothetical protein M703_03325 [Neisseria gonorrhoeae SK29344]|nr:hypothetical protein M703_03325 [Neisseria gonorrhoeae SK29344]